MDPGHLGTAFHGGAHYENFPVASWLLPARMRARMLALYQFARAGDDLADEGDAPAAQRLAGIDGLAQGLLGQQTPAPKARTLQSFIDIGTRLRHALNAEPQSIAQAQRLLDAFKRDVAHQPPATEAELFDYCSYSATPVGRITLRIADVIPQADEDSEATRLSDAICTGLQLVNFAQDLGEDFGRGRIYIPNPWWPTGSHAAHDSGRLGDLTEQDRQAIAIRMATLGLHHLKAGKGLVGLIAKSRRPQCGRLALEIGLVTEGGLMVAEKVLSQPSAVWLRSPRISKTELPVLMLRAIKTRFSSITA